MRRSGSSCLLLPKQASRVGDDDHDNQQRIPATNNTASTNLQLSVTLLHHEALPSYSNMDRDYLLSELQVHAHATYFLSSSGLSLSATPSTWSGLEEDRGNVNDSEVLPMDFPPFLMLYLRWCVPDHNNLNMHDSPTANGAAVNVQQQQHPLHHDAAGHFVETVLVPAVERLASQTALLEGSSPQAFRKVTDFDTASFHSAQSAEDVVGGTLGSGPTTTETGEEWGNNSNINNETNNDLPLSSPLFMDIPTIGSTGSSSEDDYGDEDDDKLAQGKDNECDRHDLEHSNPKTVDQPQSQQLASSLSSFSLTTAEEEGKKALELEYARFIVDDNDLQSKTSSPSTAATNTPTPQFSPADLSQQQSRTVGGALPVLMAPSCQLYLVIERVVSQAQCGPTVAIASPAVEAATAGVEQQENGKKDPEHDSLASEMDVEPPPESAPVPKQNNSKQQQQLTHLEHCNNSNDKPTFPTVKMNEDLFEDKSNVALSTKSPPTFPNVVNEDLFEDNSSVALKNIMSPEDWWQAWQDAEIAAAEQLARRVASHPRLRRSCQGITVGLCSHPGRATPALEVCSQAVTVGARDRTQYHHRLLQKSGSSSSLQHSQQQTFHPQLQVQPQQQQQQQHHNVTTAPPSPTRKDGNKYDKSWIGIVTEGHDDLLGLPSHATIAVPSGAMTGLSPTAAAIVQSYFDNTAKNVWQRRIMAEWNGQGHAEAFAGRAHTAWRVHHGLSATVLELIPKKRKVPRRKKSISSQQQQQRQRRLAGINNNNRNGSGGSTEGGLFTRCNSSYDRYNYWTTRTNGSIIITAQEWAEWQEWVFNTIAAAFVLIYIAFHFPHQFLAICWFFDPNYWDDVVQQLREL